MVIDMANHPNRGPKGSSANPAHTDVIGLRSQVQSALGCGITDAQDWCALALHTSRRAFQQWEAGDRRMHPALWELLSIKISMLNAHIQK